MRDKKTIVIIAPKFFSIEEHIINEFRTLGYQVYFFNERLNGTNFDKVMIRKLPKLYSSKINKYYDYVFHEIEEIQPNYIMVIKCETIPIQFLRNLSSIISKDKILHYMYDPMENYPKILQKSYYFGKCATFDIEDAKKYGWKHIPLFYSPYIENIQVFPSKPTYNYSFIGTLHTDRYEVIKKVIDSTTKEMRKQIYIYFYIPSKVKFLYERYIKGLYKGISLNEIYTKPLSHNQAVEIMLNSKAILDIHHDSQSGLTNRTMESVGLRRKLITTNPYVIGYSFYDKESVTIIDKESPIIDSNWLENDNFLLDKEKEFTVTCFVNSIIKLFNM